MIHIPFALILIRLALGFIILSLAYFLPGQSSKWIVSLITIGLLSDIFDGIIARKLGVSSVKLRRWDSSVDQIFFILVVLAAYVYSPVFFQEHKLKLGALIFSEVLIYVFSFVKFRKEIATHSIGAKVWTLTLFATLIEVFLSGNSGLIFNICFYLGILTRFEIILIVLSLRHWTSDVPSLWHALRLRKGKNINRSKWFNG
jgi:phosphatidylglycerophosphate synthase